MIEKHQIVGVVLAGGKASRMNFKDKPLLSLGEIPLIEHVIANAGSQVGSLVISVNRNPEKFRYLGLPLIADFDQAYAGPLVGICSALKWMIARGAEPGSSYLACFPADVPWFPENLVQSLCHAIEPANVKVAWTKCNEQVQPLFSLWTLGCLEMIEDEIRQGFYGPKLIMPKFDNVLVSFDQSEAGYFLNINTRENLLLAQKLIEK